MQYTFVESQVMLLVHDFQTYLLERKGMLKIKNCLIYLPEPSIQD